jgi:peptidyl-Asp metalloendopeptidase
MAVVPLKSSRVGVGSFIRLPLLVIAAMLAQSASLAQTKSGDEKYDPFAITPTQKATIDKIAASPIDYGALRVVSGAQGQEELLGGVPRIVLPLIDGKRITLVQTLTSLKRNGGFNWRGEVEETGERALLMLWKDGRLSGYLGYQGRIYIVNHLGGDIQALVETDPNKLPPDHAPGKPGTTTSPAPRDKPPEPTVAPFPDAERQALEAKKVIIDLMLVYTKKAIDNYMLDPADLMALAIDRANETFTNSGLGNISLRLVHSQAIDYDEAGADHFEHLYSMVDGVGPFKDIKKHRNERRADIVGLIIDNPSGCGLSTRVGADSEEAFFVVHHACAAITHSIAHEIGHILGARHDRVVDTNDTPFAYGHGYINGTKWRDMMSYRESCGGCPRIPFWSNPRVIYKGEPTGTSASDNARVILEQAERVSQFR